MQVIVVGGGVLGASAALHLVRQGAQVTLLDGKAVASGTSNAAGGFLNEWAAGAFPTWGDEELAIERYGLEFYSSLADEGADLDYVQTGAIWLATTPETWASFVRPLAEHPGVEDRQRLEPQEVEYLTSSVIPARGVVGALLHPRGIRITAPKAARAMVDRFREAGGQLREHTPVTALLSEHGRVTGVRTADGALGADLVVVAAGAWSKLLLRTAGYDAPMVPFTATRIISQPVGLPRTLPMILFGEFSFLWLRENEGRALWGCEYEVSPRYDFIASDDPELDTISGGAVKRTLEITRAAATAIPVLSEVRALAVSHGLPCYTSDLRGLIGPVPGLEGAFLVGGDNQAGVTHAPGYGRLAAESILDSESTLTDLTPFRLDRFAENSPNAIAAAAAETVFDLVGRHTSPVAHS
jgi:glycine/D-amino acid oxidase-like deaminating enzyme